jgi:multidrug resistance efflux pump
MPTGKHESTANLAKTTYQRGENLYRQGVISRQRRDEMLAAQTSAQELSEAAYQQYARAKRGSTSQQKSTADAQVEIAKAAVSEAKALRQKLVYSLLFQVQFQKLMANLLNSLLWVYLLSAF